MYRRREYQRAAGSGRLEAAQANLSGKLVAEAAGISKSYEGRPIVVLHGMSKAQAQDGGTWSHSMTYTKVHDGDVESRTKSMSHAPGGRQIG